MVRTRGNTVGLAESKASMHFHQSIFFTKISVITKNAP